MALDIAGALGTKYRILGQQADAQSMNAETQRTVGNAQAGLIGAQTATQPAEAAAREAAERGQAASGTGLGAYYGAQAAQAPGLAQSEIGLRLAQTATQPAEAAAREAAERGQAASGTGLGAYYGSQAAQAPGLAQSEIGLRSAQTFGVMEPFGDASPDFIGAVRQQLGATVDSNKGFNKGTPDLEAKTGKNRVPGEGSGKVDTVPAKLAPGEAVLNKAAAEHLGRDTIALLNAIGEVKMGTAGSPNGATPHTSAEGPDGGGEPVPGYAQGVSQVLGPPLTVPGPGQTTTNGTWTPANATGVSSQSGNTPLREKLGMGVPRLGFAKGTEKVPPKGAEKAPMKGAEKAPPKAMKGAEKAPAKGKEAAAPGKLAIDHGTLAALLQMHGHAIPGGMPNAGAPSMPLSMPMVGSPPPQIGGGGSRLPMQGGGQ